MNPEELKANAYYKTQYEYALEMASVLVAPAWEDLTNEARESVRKECVRYQQELSAFGEMLRKSVNQNEEDL